MFCINYLSLLIKMGFIILILIFKFNKTQILKLLNKTEQQIEFTRFKAFLTSSIIETEIAKTKINLWQSCKQQSFYLHLLYLTLLIFFDYFINSYSQHSYINLIMFLVPILFIFPSFFNRIFNQLKIESKILLISKIGIF